MASEPTTPNVNEGSVDSRRKILKGLVWAGLFATMVFGMVAKGIYDYLLAGRTIGSDIFAQKELLTQIVLPILVSPMVFGALYGYASGNPMNLGTFIFAFQNGFFWKTIFGDLGRTSDYSG